MEDLRNLASRIAREYGIPEDIFFRLITRESGWNPRARGAAGEIGLGQLLPSTAQSLGLTDPWDPEQNLRGAARYLRLQYDRFKDWYKAAMAYNAGPNAVLEGRVPSRSHDYARYVAGSPGLNTDLIDQFLFGTSRPRVESPLGTRRVGDLNTDIIARFLSLPRHTERALLTDVALVNRAPVRVQEEKREGKPLVPTPMPSRGKLPPYPVERGPKIEVVPTPTPSRGILPPYPGEQRRELPPPHTAPAGRSLTAPQRFVRERVLPSLYRTHEWAARVSTDLGYLPDRAREQTLARARVLPFAGTAAAEASARVLAGLGQLGILAPQFPVGIVSGALEAISMTPEERERVRGHLERELVAAIKDFDLHRAYNAVMSTPLRAIALGVMGAALGASLAAFPAPTIGGLFASTLLAPVANRTGNSAAQVLRRMGANEKVASSVGGIVEFILGNLAWAAGSAASLGAVAFRSSFLVPKNLARAAATGDVPTELLAQYATARQMREAARYAYHGTIADQTRMYAEHLPQLQQALRKRTNAMFPEDRAPTMRRAFEHATKAQPQGDISQQASLALVLKQARDIKKTFDSESLRAFIKGEAGLDVKVTGDLLSYVNAKPAAPELLNPYEVVQLTKAGVRAAPFSPLWYEDFAHRMQQFYGPIPSPNLRLRATSVSTYLASRRSAIDEIRAAFPIFNAIAEYLEKEMPVEMRSALLAGKVDDAQLTQWLYSKRKDLIGVVNQVEEFNVLKPSRFERVGVVDAFIHGVPGGPKVFGYWASTISKSPDAQVRALAAEILPRYVKVTKSKEGTRLVFNVPRGKSTSSLAVALDDARNYGVISEGTTSVRRWNPKTGKFDEVPVEVPVVNIGAPLAALDTWMLRVFGTGTESIKSARQALELQRSILQATEVLNRDTRLLDILRKGFGRKDFVWTPDAVQATLWVLRRGAKDILGGDIFDVIWNSMAGTRAVFLERMLVTPPQVALEYRDFLASRVLEHDSAFRAAETLLRERAATVLPKALAFKGAGGAITEVSSAVVRFPVVESSVARDHAAVLSWALGTPIQILEPGTGQRRSVQILFNPRKKIGLEEIDQIRAIISETARRRNLQWSLVESGKNAFLLHIPSGLGEVLMPRLVQNLKKRLPGVQTVFPDPRTVSVVSAVEDEALQAFKRISGLGDEGARALMGQMKETLARTQDIRAQVPISATGRVDSPTLDDSLRTVLVNRYINGPAESGHPAVKDFVAEVHRSSDLWKATVEALADESGQIGGRDAIKHSVLTHRYRKAAEDRAYEVLMTLPPEGRTYERFANEFTVRFESIVRDLEDAGRPYWLDRLYEKAIIRSTRENLPWDATRRWLVKEIGPDEPLPKYSPTFQQAEEAFSHLLGTEKEAFANVLRGGRIPIEEQVRRATAAPEALAYDLLMLAEQRLPELGQSIMNFSLRLNELAGEAGQLLDKVMRGETLNELEISRLASIMGRSYVLFSAMKATGSEGGRILRTLRESSRMFRNNYLPYLNVLASTQDPGAIREAFRRLINARDASVEKVNERLRDLMMEMGYERPLNFLAALDTKLTRDTSADKVIEMMRSGLLYSAPTHIRNFIGTVFYGAYELLMKEVGRFFTGPLEKIARHKGLLNRYYTPPGEAQAWFLEGLSVGVSEYPQIFTKRVLATITAHGPDLEREGIKVSTYGRLDKPVGYAIRLPFGIIAGMDGAGTHAWIRAKSYESAFISRMVEKSVANDILALLDNEKIANLDALYKELFRIDHTLSKLPQERGGWARREVRRLMLAVVDRKGLPIDEVKAVLREWVDKYFAPTAPDRQRIYYILEKGEDYIIPGATDYAKKLTFNKKLSADVEKVVSTFYDSQNPTVRFIARFLFPFVRTPLNILSEMVWELTPAAAYRGWQHFLRGDIEAAAASLAKTLMSTSMAMTGYLMGEAGLLNGVYPDDPQYRNMRYAQGELPMSLKVGGHVISLRGLSPVTLPVLFGASLNEFIKYVQWKKAGDPNYPADEAVNAQLDTIFSMAWAIGRNVILEESWLRSVDDLYSLWFRGGELGVEERFARFVGQTLTKAIPFSRLLGTIADISDPYVRERRWLSAKAEVPFWEIVKREVYSNLPGLRQRLAVRMGPLGEPMKTAVGGGVSPFLAFLWPVRVLEEHPLYQEWARVGVMAPRVVPRVAGRPMLREEAIRLLSGVRGAYIQAVGSEILQHPVYTEATDEQRAQIWRRLFREVSERTSEFRRWLEEASWEEIEQEASRLVEEAIEELRAEYPSSNIEVAPLR